MKNATFYLLPADAADQPLSAAEIAACDLAAHFWREGKRILIACHDEAQALRLDEALWQRPADAFVPHNLAGEGPRQGAPVELAWPQKRGSSARDLLISLLPHFADFATGFYEVVDFVPEDNNLKQLARDRYKAYRSAGFQLNTVTAASA
ncbi:MULTISPECIES: DNA polymerase III subunit chi [Erwiniaceae]|uniref:DNA polymerase III subunit chi n=1 Tax=Erwiniaceae TaxID=1903409 RepID=UPI0006647751|nr:MULTISPECIES: DNA polymerase III subunit chi [Erwiniaceae]KMV74070.1 DNA polymerase III subunit chi [bacteria symbiont BFo2 of Frankliniella occidentalis]KYP90389.1 DNA polymerase III subunit chi [bacteria symbiont BFo2 of Frankliniella occidentalis]KYP95870.1 DNA polymerase III subunit chi [bacteria symbiont BFo2 of Frankliniella occidentalis]PIJ44240.1 DNA polymerase III subunit chi [Tatumella sp. OPLPL6]